MSDDIKLVPKAAEEVVHKRKKRADLENFGQEYVQPGDNSRFLRHIRGHMNLPPIDISDDQQVGDRIDWYFNQCQMDDMKPTVLGLCNCLGIDKTTLYDWKVGGHRAKTHSPLIQKAYKQLEELWEAYMINGKINPASGIFLGRNHWGYQDQVQVVVSPGDRVSDGMRPEQIEAQLKDIPEDE